MMRVSETLNTDTLAASYKRGSGLTHWLTAMPKKP